MPQYSYKARNDNGKLESGVMLAENATELHQKLKNKNLHLVSYSDKQEVVNNSKIRPKVLSEFCRDIGTFLKTGITLVKAIAIISQDEATPIKFRNIYADILRQVRQGSSLSEAMAAQGRAFPTMMIKMFRAAEETGKLDETAFRMAEHYDKEHRLNSKIKNATTYPKILGALIVLVVTFIMSFVLPRFESMFAKMDTLPLPTRILYGISGFITSYWKLLILGIILLIIAFALLLRVQRVRWFLDMLKIKMPLIGRLYKAIFSARFARTLSSLYSAGIPLINSVQIAKDTIGNRYIEKQFDAVIADVCAGNSLSESLADVDGFVKKLTSTILIGEETGSLDTMLESIANALDYDSEQAIAKLVSYLEPLMIVLLALIVGGIMIAVIVPIYNSYNTIGH